MTAEERLAKIRGALEDEMVYIYDECTTKFTDDEERSMLKPVFKSTFMKWAICLDSENVIDMYELECWKRRVERVESL